MEDKKENQIKNEEKEMSDLERITFYNSFSSIAEVGAGDALNEILRKHSLGGFLGRDEDLIEIKKQDYLTLRKHGLSYDEIIAPLEKIAAVSLENYKRKIPVTILDKEYRPVSFKGEEQKLLYKKYGPFKIRPIMNALMESRMMEAFPEAKYRIITEKLSDASCPWYGLQDEIKMLGCDYHIQPNYEFTIRNLDNKREVSYNLMQIHMIQQHHFFEGRGTMFNLVRNPYRVEPEEIIRTLELGKYGVEK